MIAPSGVSRTLVLVSRKGARFSPAAQVLYDLIRKRSAHAARAIG